MCAILVLSLVHDKVACKTAILFELFTAYSVNSMFG